MFFLIDLEFDDGVFVLRMRNGENRLNLDFVRALNDALDEVEGSTGPASLVTTGEGKFYSNGLDLPWMLGEGAAQMGEFGPLLQRTFARLVAFPVITVAALNGHVFAAGAVLALAQDFRVMRSDRGFFCLPEVDLQVPFPAGIMSVVQSRLPAAMLHEAILSGRRYDPSEALAGRAVDAALPEAEVLPRAVEMARGLADKHRPTIVALKKALYSEVLEKLEAAARRAENAS